MITFECAECNQTLEVSDDLAGRKIKCRKCDSRQIVPKPEAANRERGKKRKSALPYILIAVLLVPFIMYVGCLTLVSITSAISQQSQIHRSIHQGLNAEQWVKRFCVAVKLNRWHGDPAFDEADDAIMRHLPARDTVPLFLEMLQEQDDRVQIAALWGIGDATVRASNRYCLMDAVLPVSRVLYLNRNADARAFAADLLGKAAIYISEDGIRASDEQRKIIKEALKTGRGDPDEDVRFYSSRGLEKVTW
jgi:DNA-directed RNA polymerase subunit RPC12/RpoP